MEDELYDIALISKFLNVYRFYLFEIGESRMKTILSPARILNGHMMWKTKTVIILAFYSFVTLNLPNSVCLIYGQISRINDSTTNNNNESELTTNNSTLSATSQNDTRIMENTSGMIDEAFGAIKDSFKSLFGK